MLTSLLLGFWLQSATPTQLFNKRDLSGWHIDSPALDKEPSGAKPFLVENGILVTPGNPAGQLVTDADYSNYRLTVEYRWSGQPGNSGILVHCSTPRTIANLIPKCLEVQLMSGHAGDFYLLGETIKVQDMDKRNTDRRIVNLTDDSEKPVGQWNEIVVECLDRIVKVWVNGVIVNEGADCSVAKGQIGLQSEGAPLQFRKVELLKLD